MSHVIMPSFLSINLVSFSSWNIVRMSVSKTLRSLTFVLFLQQFCSPAFFLFLEYNFYFFVCLVDDWTFKRMLDLNGDLSLDSEPPPPGLTWSVPWLVGSVVSTAYALCGFPSVDPISSWSENVYKTLSLPPLQSLSIKLSACWYYTSC